ncbi:MAG: hypothetical protein RL187_274 [Actinomycetota bacterium]|jgi:hypothetical protein
MTRGAHVVWIGTVTIAGALAFLSLWSDVWEAYVGLFIVDKGAYGLMARRTCYGISAAIAPGAISSLQCSAITARSSSE